MLLTASLWAGCIFQPRSHEPPDEGEQVEWEEPESPDIALDNMKGSLENKILDNYGRSFSEDRFELILDTADEAELGQNEFISWSAIQEEQRMSGILSSTEATLTISWVAPDWVDDGSVRFYRDLSYRLKFEEPTRTVVYSGLVDLYFEDDGTGSWYVVKWVDKRDGSPNRTWGWLRARNVVEF